MPNNICIYCSIITHFQPLRMSPDLVRRYSQNPKLWPKILLFFQSVPQPLLCVVCAWQHIHCYTSPVIFVYHPVCIVDSLFICLSLPTVYPPHLTSPILNSKCYILNIFPSDIIPLCFIMHQSLFLSCLLLLIFILANLPEWLPCIATISCSLLKKMWNL